MTKLRAAKTLTELNYNLMIRSIKFDHLCRYYLEDSETSHHVGNCLVL